MVKQANLACRRLYIIKSRLAISSPDEFLVIIAMFSLHTKFKIVVLPLTKLEWVSKFKKWSRDFDHVGGSLLFVYQI